MIKRVLLLIITVLMLSVFAWGCAPGHDEDNQLKGSVLVNDFENLQDTRSIITAKYFGAWWLNDDMAYVRSGVSSLKIKPSGYGTQDPLKGDPTIGIEINKINPLLTNFASAKQVVMDIFNSQEDMRYVNLSLADAGGMTTPAQKFTLNKQGWTKVVLDIDYDNLNYIYDMGKINQVLLSFEHLHYKTTTPTYYIDNLRINMLDVARTDKKAELDAGEISSFDKEYQAHVVYPSGFGATVGIEPILSINTDERYVKSGKSLRVDMPYGVRQDASWPLFLFSSKLIKQVNWASYSADNELVCDIYNANSSTMVMDFRITLSEEYSGKIYKASTVVPANSWGVMRIKLSAINTANPTIEGKTDAHTHIAGLGVAWGEFPGQTAADNKVYYFDNFRVE